jgi:hypothetical protein
MPRSGLDVPTQTLRDQTWVLALKLERTANRIHAHVLEQDVAIGDGTHWKRLEKPPIVNAIGLRTAELRAVPETPIAKAIMYLDNHWRGLVVFLSDPRVAIASNAAERALRSPVLGRKTTSERDPTAE